MIEFLEPATLSCIHRSPGTTATLGSLDKLPLELVHCIFSSLDLRSLVNVKRTCLRGTVLVESLPEFRDLVRYAPEALAALGCTGLIRCHSARTLHAVLLDRQCAKCQRSGPYLFLPTCERCCSECLSTNQSLWVIAMPEAQKCFQLEEAAMRRLPHMRSQPDDYHRAAIWHMLLENIQYRLVSVKVAKELTIEQFGSVQIMERQLEEQRKSLSWPDFDDFCAWQTAPLQPIRPEARTFPLGEENCDLH